ncbi:MAG: hypothetical protein KC646_15940, partial [Candidatus Cloacimonetes bacterium]|nr:hypothetical protein [Candidatus Cloacimonadota bacterium]
DEEVDFDFDDDDEDGEVTMDLGAALDAPDEEVAEEESDEEVDFDFDDDDENGEVTMDLGAALDAPDEEVAEEESDEEVDFDFDDDDENGEVTMDLGAALDAPDEEVAEEESDEELSFDFDDEEEDGEVTMDFGVALDTPDEEVAEDESDEEVSFDFDDEEEDGEVAMDFGVALDASDEEVAEDESDDFIAVDLVFETDTSDHKITFEEGLVDSDLVQTEDLPDSQYDSVIDQLNTMDEDDPFDASYSDSAYAGMDEKEEFISADPEISDFIEAEGLSSSSENFETPLDTPEPKPIETIEKVTTKYITKEVPQQEISLLDSLCKSVEDSAYLLEDGFIDLKVDLLPLELSVQDNQFEDPDDLAVESLDIPEFLVDDWDTFLLDLSPSLSEMRLKLDQSFLETPKLIPELQRFCEYHSQDSLDYQALYTLSEIYLNEGDKLHSLQIKTGVLDRLQKDNNPEEVLELCLEIYELFPEDESIIGKILKIYREEERHNDRELFVSNVIRYFTNVDKLNEASKYYQFGLEQNYVTQVFLSHSIDLSLKLNNYENALHAVEQYLENHSETVSILKTRVFCHEQQNNESKVLISLKRLLPISDEPIPVMEKIISILDNQKRVDELSGYCDQLLSLDRENHLALRMLEKYSPAVEEEKPSFTMDFEKLEETLEVILEKKLKGLVSDAKTKNTVNISNVIENESFDTVDKQNEIIAEKTTENNPFEAHPVEKIKPPIAQVEKEVESDQIDFDDFDDFEFGDSPEEFHIIHVINSIGNQSGLGLENLNKIKNSFGEYSTGKKMNDEDLLDLFKSIQLLVGKVKSRNKTKVLQTELKIIKEWGAKESLNLHDAMLGFVWQSEFSNLDS